MTFPAEVLADSPLLYQQFNETVGTNADDSTANNRDGTYTGGYTLGAAGGRSDGDTAVALNGSTGYIAYSYNPFSAGGSRTFMIAALRTSGAVNQALFSSTGGGQMLRLPGGDTNVAWYPDTATVPTVWGSGTWPGDNVFVLVHLLFNDAAHTAELYVNGVSKGQNTGVATQSATSNLIVGAWSTNAYFLGGTVGEFAAFSGLLSGARCLAHYNAMVANPVPVVGMY